MKWIFDPTPPSGNDKGESPFGAMLEDAASKIGNMTSLFVRETIANSADQRKQDNTHPVDIFIDFISISGNIKKTFKDSMDWDSLSEHVEAAMGDGQSSPTPTQINLKHSHTNMNNNEQPTLLVRVSDYNANGLIGAETEKEDNFHLFCKSVFKTSSSNLRQGSFGLGKGVFYHQSGLSTVLMSSYCDVDGQNKMRVFGRSELQSHVCEEGKNERGTEECDGPGFFGIPTETPRGHKAVSSIDDPNKELKNLFLDRDLEMGTGTSVISLAYKKEVSVENTIAHFNENIKKWFWPALCSSHKPINITIRQFNNHDHEEESDVIVSLTPEYKPFAKAFNGIDDSRDLNEIGTIASKDLGWDIPKKNEDACSSASWDNGRPFKANGIVKMHRSDAAFDTQHLVLKNHIAFLRNNLCVVKYEQINIFSEDTDSYFYGVFKGGDAKGDSIEDKKFSSLLRSAEPPLHNNWDYKYKIENTYDISKVHTFLTTLDRDIQNAATDLADVQEIRTSENLEHLASLFKFGKSGTGEVSRFISDSILDQDLNGRDISVKVKVNNLKEDGLDWEIDTYFAIDGINSSENNLILQKVDIDDESIEDKISINLGNKGASIKIDSSISSFIFNLHAAIPDILNDDLAERQDYKISVVSRG